VGMTDNGRLCDFLLSFLKSGGPTDLDQMKQAASRSLPDVAARLRDEFPHAVHAALETLGRQGLAIHCRPDGSPAKKGERTGCWKLR
jgi:hypothetical protein